MAPAGVSGHPPVAGFLAGSAAAVATGALGADTELFVAATATIEPTSTRASVIPVFLV